MTFTTVYFIPFLLAAFFTVLLAKTEKNRQKVLLAYSVAFYATWGIKPLALLCACTIGTFLCGRLLRSVKRENGGVKGRIIFISGISLLAWMLCFFKYGNVFLPGLREGWLPAAAPVGFSFFIFSCIGYLADVFKDGCKEDDRFFDVALFLLFFPKILQGPLEKSGGFLKGLKEQHCISWECISAGCQIFLFGFMKKVVIADRLALFVDAVYEAPSAFSGATLLLTALAYPVQLYCDFSGYSDMAVGTAKIFGYGFCRNFNLPYASVSVAEYWRRWHISLGQWFKDYVYIPLGGGRAGFARMAFNLFIVWCLTGVWHGLGLTFLIWALLNFMIIVIEKKTKAPQKHPAISRMITFVLITIGWVWFRAPDVAAGGAVLKGIVTWKPGIDYIYTWAVLFILVIAAATAVAYVKNNKNGTYIVLDLTRLGGKAAVCFALMMTLILMYVGQNYFLYFDF